jgi:hypothetical protein
VQHGNEKPERKPLFCIKDGTWDLVKKEGVWNPEVTIDHLAICYKPGGTAFSTVGYQPHASDSIPYKHQMQLSEDPANPTVFQPHIVAHEVSSPASLIPQEELADVADWTWSVPPVPSSLNSQTNTTTVLDLLHEHQRFDRESPILLHTRVLTLASGDHYVEYNPVFVKGFREAINRATADGSSFFTAIKNFQHGVGYYRKYNFLGSEFVKGGLEPFHPIDGESGFDYESIMLYPSIGSSHNRCYANVDQCALVNITKDENGKVVKKGRINTIYSPSQKDVEFVKKCYP